MKPSADCFQATIQMIQLPLFQEVAEKCKSRFWRRVEKLPSGCWEWQGARHEKGYGLFWLNGQQFKAHRVAFLLASCVQPAEKMVLHQCDNPPCVNPSHLFLGTNDENICDKVTKGRSARPVKWIPASARLNEEAVKEIRSLADGGSPYCAIAEKFSVDATTVSLAVRRKTWKHVD